MYHKNRFHKTRGGFIMSANRLDELRKEVDQVNLRLLDLINRRGELIKQIGDIKTEQGINVFDPIREREMLDLILKNHDGHFEYSTIEHLFKEIFKAAKELIEEDQLNALLVSRQKKPTDTVVNIGENIQIGNGHREFVFGRAQWNPMNKWMRWLKRLKRRVKLITRRCI